MVKETIVLGPLVAASTYAQAVFADGVEVAPNVIVGLLGNAGIVGALIWYMWYSKTKSEPKQLETFAAQQDAQREANAAQMEAQRVGHEARLDKLRETFQTQIDRMRDVFEKQLERLREYAEKERAASARETAELRGVMLEMAKNMRIAVHDIKDSANAAILKSDATVERLSKQSDSKHG